MSGIDATIPLGIKVPDTMHTLGSILDIQAKRQAIDTGAIQQQRAGVQLEQEQGALNAQRKVAAVVSDPAFRNPATGEWDLNRAAAAIVQADPMDYHATKAISAMAKANSDVMAVKKNSIGLADTSRAFVGSTLGALSDNPKVTKADAMTALDVAEEQAPDAKPSIDVWRRHLKAVPDDPSVLQGYFKIARNQAMPPATQVGAMTPNGIQVGNGQQTQVVNTSQGTQLPPGAPIPGTVQQQQLPPTTPVFNPETNTPGYLGPQPPARTWPSPWPTAAGTPAPSGSGGVARLDVVQPSKRVIQSGPALGAAENVAGTVDAVNKDWTATTESARGAQQDIGVLQNIKKYAPGAITGVASDRQAFLTGIAGKLGMSTEQLEKTNTDLLAKNSAMLALAGGNTDLARVLAESANPNTHMTPEAIQDAANQVIAQRKMAVAKQRYMGHFKGDPEMYSKELTHFNQIADPRALQLQDMTPDEKIRMKAAMSPSEQKEFGQKVRKLEALGIIQ